MGLDVTAYSRLKPVGKHVDGWCENYEEHVEAFAYSSFPASFRGIKVLGERRDFIEGGCYAFTDDTERHEFRAGSYGGYNKWRSDLQEQFNPAVDADEPFYELIYFADNEGTIGPEAARDLLADFREHAERYGPPSDGGAESWYRDAYRDWTRACELAADDGLIHLH